MSQDSPVFARISGGFRGFSIRACHRVAHPNGANSVLSGRDCDAVAPPLPKSKFSLENRQSNFELFFVVSNQLPYHRNPDGKKTKVQDLNVIALTRWLAMSGRELIWQVPAFERHSLVHRAYFLRQ